MKPKYDKNGHDITWMRAERKYRKSLKELKKITKQSKSQKTKKKIIYRSYIKSSQWRYKSKKFQQIKKYKCEICGKRSQVVHHLHYKTLGKEKLKDIQVLCHGCHASLHKIDIKIHKKYNDEQHEIYENR